MNGDTLGGILRPYEGNPISNATPLTNEQIAIYIYKTALKTEPDKKTFDALVKLVKAANSDFGGVAQYVGELKSALGGAEQLKNFLTYLSDARMTVEDDQTRDKLRKTLGAMADGVGMELSFVVYTKESTVPEALYKIMGMTPAKEPSIVDLIGGDYKNPYDRNKGGNSSVIEVNTGSEVETPEESEEIETQIGITKSFVDAYNLLNGAFGDIYFKPRGEQDWDALGEYEHCDAVVKSIIKDAKNFAKKYAYLKVVGRGAEAYAKKLEEAISTLESTFRTIYGKEVDFNIEITYEEKNEGKLETYGIRKAKNFKKKIEPNETVIKLDNNLLKKFEKMGYGDLSGGITLKQMLAIMLYTVVCAPSKEYAKASMGGISQTYYGIKVFKTKQEAEKYEILRTSVWNELQDIYFRATGRKYDTGMPGPDVKIVGY